MEDFKSLFIATGLFATAMLTGAHLRYPNDSAISYLLSSTQDTIGTAPVPGIRPAPRMVGEVVEGVVPAKSRPLAALFEPMPLSAMLAPFEPARSHSALGRQMQQVSAPPAAKTPAVVDARTRQRPQTLAEGHEASVTSPIRFRFDLQGGSQSEPSGGREG